MQMNDLMPLCRPLVTRNVTGSLFPSLSAVSAAECGAAVGLDLPAAVGVI